MDDIIRICDGASVIIDDLNNHINRVRKLAEGKKPPANSARDETVTYRKCCECAISCDRRSSGDCGYGYGV